MRYEISDYSDSIKFIKVINDKNLSIVLCNFGAGIFSIRYNDEPLILEFKNKEDWLYNLGYYGKTLGPVAGRIKSELNLNSLLYKISENEICLHGDELNSLSFKTWDYKIEELDNKLKVIFYITNYEKDSKFPGDVNFKVIYEIPLFYNNINISYFAKSNKDTIINLSNHCYYNFNNPEGIGDYLLKISSNYIGLANKDNLIIDKIKTPWFIDFNRACKIDKNLELLSLHSKIDNLDHTFLIENEVNEPIFIKNDKYKLVYKSSYPACNFFIDSLKTKNEFIQIKENDSIKRGIAIEPQLFNLDLDSLILKKGKTYKHSIKIKFKKNV